MGKRLDTTAEHPFYELESAPWLAVGALQGRWTDALDLQAGDRIWKADGTSGVVQSVAVAPVQQRMYNLTVADAYTFFVGEQQWLVHNAGPCDAFEAAKSGGKHSGFYSNHLTDTEQQLRKGIRSLDSQITEHYDKIANPRKYIAEWDELDPRQQKHLVETKWLKDIERQQEQKDILQGILNGRGN